MTDPIGGGVGKAAQQMMQEMQKQMNEQAGEVGGADKAKFNDTMVQDVQKTQDISKTQKVQDVTNPSNVLRTAQNNSVNGAQNTTGVRKVEGTTKSSESSLKKMLNQMVDGQNKLDDIIKMATSGKAYSQQDLLAIQASVYKFSQELDLTSKVVEKATSGIKQTMQTQV
ncbi:MAG: ATP-dependent helicase HrpB [Deltaproteobacteria bacterium]|nr:ATP-dependent helicase HrpB [Deltaproteobacteria bacterium]